VIETRIKKTLCLQFRQEILMRNGFFPAARGHCGEVV